MVENDGRHQLEKLEYPKECKLSLRGISDSLLLKPGIISQIYGSSHTPKLFTNMFSLRNHANAKFCRECDNQLVITLCRYSRRFKLFS